MVAPTEFITTTFDHLTVFPPRFIQLGDGCPAGCKICAGTLTEDHVDGAPSRGGACEMTMSCCMCEPTERSESPLAMTHLRWLRGHSESAVVSVECELGPSIGARTWTRARETPTLANVIKLTTSRKCTPHDTVQYDTTQYNPKRADRRLSRFLGYNTKVHTHLAQLSDHM